MYMSVCMCVCVCMCVSKKKGFIVLRVISMLYKPVCEIGIGYSICIAERGYWVFGYGARGLQGRGVGEDGDGKRGMVMRRKGVD